VLLINHGAEAFEIKHGERIAQMIVASHETVSWLPEAELTETLRGAGGYGSSGI
jgi:dUTP pyrophosphatase